MAQARPHAPASLLSHHLSMTDPSIQKAPSLPLSDEEKSAAGPDDVPTLRPLEHGKGQVFHHRFQRLATLFARAQVESQGIVPLSREAQTNTAWWSVGFLWFSGNFNILSFSTGTLAASFGLSFYGAYGTFIGFGLLCALPPAYLTTFGPPLGMRQLVQSRYSWGFWPTCLIALLSAATMVGFCILNAILGGQALAAVSSATEGWTTASSGGGAGQIIPVQRETMSTVVGIVVVCVCALIISFFGIRILHAFERAIWVLSIIPFVSIIAVAGTGPRGLHIPDAAKVQSTEKYPAHSAAPVLAMAGVVAGFFIPYAPLASDMSLYLRPQTNSWKLFLGTYAGFVLSSIPAMMLGAAFAYAAMDIPSWQNALDKSVGALFNTVLAGPQTRGSSALRGFGKFATVLLALSTLSNLALTFYSLTLAFQTFLPFTFIYRTPRFFFSIVVTAIVLPTAIAGANHFYDTLSTFTTILSYWSALYIAVVMTEHIVFRKATFANYDRSLWDAPSKLPLGIGAMSAALLSLAPLIPSASQTWYTGPIAKHSGDLGFEVGFAACVLLYIPCRYLELRIFKR